MTPHPAPDTAEALLRALLVEREKLRLHMLEQPFTDTNDTYSDGYGAGLSVGIRHIDKVLGTALYDPSLTRPTGTAATELGTDR